MPTTVSFGVDLTDPAAAYTPLATVGTIEEVGINGVGYMLLDNTDFDQGDIRKSLLQYSRKTIPLDPQRFATSDTPFTEAIDRYSFIALGDFRGGAGQRLADRSDSDASRFYDSEGVDPFTTGKASLLHSLDTGANTYTQLRCVVIGTRLYVQTGAKQISYYDSVAALTSAVPTGTFSIAAATQITDLTTDGTSWYAAAGAAGIFKGTTADPGAAWSTQRAFSVGYAAGRICAGVDSTGSGTLPNRFTTLNSAGAEEVAGGRITLSTGATITNFVGGDGFVWFGVYASDQGWVYVWDVTANTPYVALEPLPGQAVRSVFYGQGNVFVRVEQRSSTTAATARIYRCPVDTKGVLSPFAVVDLKTPAATDHGPGTFGGDGDKVFFSWLDQDSAATGKDGIGAISLTSGGYSKWHQGGVGGSTATVRSIFRWQNRLCFSLDGVGIYLESPTSYLTTGFLATSAYDQASTLDKVYDFITVNVAPLNTGEQFDVGYTIDPSLVSAYTSFPTASVSGAGTARKQTSFARKGAALGLKLTFTGPGTSSPTLNVVQVRLHPAGLADTVLQLPINCGDDIGNLQGGDYLGNGPGAGAIRARVLESLIQSRVLYQDIDYQATATAEVFEVVDVDTRSLTLFSRRRSQDELFMVALVTLRKATK